MVSWLTHEKNTVKIHCRVFVSIHLSTIDKTRPTQLMRENLIQT